MTIFMSLAIYIHWPFCKSKCPYCDFNSHVRDRVDQARWRAALLKELEYMAAQVPDRRMQSIFFGGGTPSLMPPDTAAALIQRVRELWPEAKNVEITLEANPTSVEAETFKAFKAAGVNRLSLGVQSLRDEELKFLGRGHSAKEALAAIALARETFERYSFDLIYARPGQTPEMWKQELTEALAHAGSHLSLYQLTIEENTAFHHAYAKGGFTLPDEATAEALYRLTEELLADRGLRAYEVSNYAAPGQESRHNLAYWQGMEYVGVGPGAHGRLSEELGNWRIGESEEEKQLFSRSPILQFYNCPLRIATQTLKSPERWLEQVERQGHGVEIWQPVAHEQEIEERIMMGLRLTNGIHYETFARQMGKRLEDCIDVCKRDQFIGQGLLAEDAERLRTTLKGRLVLTTLMVELLA